MNLTQRFEPEVVNADCLSWLRRQDSSDTDIDLTFLDPPFNQGKAYDGHDDSMPDAQYWDWMGDVCEQVRRLSSDGAAIYFMQREKNTEEVLRVLRESGWSFQNLIVWRKKTSAVPGIHRFGKSFQIIAFATKSPRPRAFNRLRIDPPLPEGYSARDAGVFVTDVWDDIRELTSGYFAGNEPLRNEHGHRLHKQQSPLSLLTRIVLASTMPGDLVLDPFAGTGTTLCAASGLARQSIGIEKSERNVAAILQRLDADRPVDDVDQFREDYIHTPGLSAIWGLRQDDSVDEVCQVESIRLVQTV